MPCIRPAAMVVASIRVPGVPADLLLSVRVPVRRRAEVWVDMQSVRAPVMDGIEFVRRLKHIELAKNVSVVIISSEGGEGARVARAVGRSLR